MTEIKLSIPGQPVGKERPRFGKNNQIYTPQQTKDYENRVKTYALCINPELNALSSTAFSGGVAVFIKAFYPVPKSATKKERELITSGKRPLVKPDLDNIGKIILDALNGVAYLDDKQVICLSIEKLYDDHPRVHLTLVYLEA